MKAIIRKITWLDRRFMEFGWGNGYVIIPKDHILHGKDYDHINVDIHGGLTFSDLITKDFMKRWNEDEQDENSKLKNEDEGCWIIGFDTAHPGDSLINWPKEEVKKETENLLNQVLNYKEVLNETL